MKALILAVMTASTLIVSLAGLPACTPVMLSERILTPSLEGTTLAQDGYGYNVYCPLPTVGRAPSFDRSKDVLVGFENYFDQGSGLFPCQAKQDWDYLGVVQFNLEGFANKIVTAKFIFDWKWTSKSGPGTTADSAARQIWLRTGNSVYYQRQPVIDLSSGDHGITVDVSQIVRDWADGRTANFGFVLSGPDENFPENNDHWVSGYGSFRLDVLYNPM